MPGRYLRKAQFRRNNNHSRWASVHSKISHDQKPAVEARASDLLPPGFCATVYHGPPVLSYFAQNQHHHLGWQPAESRPPMMGSIWYAALSRLRLSQLSDVPPYAGPAAKKTGNQQNTMLHSPHSFRSFVLIRPRRACEPMTDCSYAFLWYTGM